MKHEQRKKGIILLKDGTVFHGYASGASGTATGEICFNTGMTGYQEIFTDPSYHGQILTCASSHIGNYGIEDSEVESDDVKISGLIVKKFSEFYSRPRASQSLDEYLKKEGIVAIHDVDTRALVMHIRDNGAMNAIISSEEFDIKKLKAILDKVPSMDGLELASKVSTSKAYEVGDPNAKHKVALLDLGTKKNIIRSLNERDCLVRVYPYNTGASEIMSWKPDGVQISNGPGDPAPLEEAIDTVRELVENNVPIFGICLGHQILSLSQGLQTTKMHNGHRGINHPVKNMITGHCEVTSQNHGFVVDMELAEKNPDIEVTHIHLNDGTLAGLQLKNKPVFSVQYHPEASPGPLDSRYLFDNFIDLMNSQKKDSNELHRQHQRQTNS